MSAKSVQAYGVGPMAPGGLGGAHSDDEHISTAGLMKRIEDMPGDRELCGNPDRRAQHANSAK